MNYRKDFPFFNHSNLAYLDNAATTQKPQAVIDAVSNFYVHGNAPVHRGIYDLAEQATAAYEAARAMVARFINAQSPSEIVFVKNTTEGINLIAQAWGQSNLQPGDEIVLTELEHHANLAPWQRLAHEKGLKLRFIPIRPDLTIDESQLDQIISPRAKLVAFAPISHIGGPLNPELVKKIISLARQVGARVLLDAAQMMAHGRVDVQALDCDFLVFSGHKMFGPTGSGAVYIRACEHKNLQPQQVGGGMIYAINYQSATWKTMPALLEAGSPSVAQAIGLAAAIDYLNTVDFSAVAAHESSLMARFLKGLQEIPEVQLMGSAEQLVRGHLACFYSKTIHAHDVAAVLAHKGIAVRAGNHCCQPMHTKLGISSSVRVSFALYNTQEEVDKLLAALRMLAIEGL